MADPKLAVTTMGFGGQGKYRLQMQATQDGKPIPNAKVEVIGNDGTVASVRADENGAAAVLWTVKSGNVWLHFTVQGCPSPHIENLFA